MTKSQRNSRSIARASGDSHLEVLRESRIIEPTEFPNLLIRASAGTGKTYQISNRYLQLLLTGGDAERILATTFTRKAAGEILQRIMFRLADAATDDSSATQLASQIRLSGVQLRDCRRALRQTTQALHRLRVATLDAFFLQATQSLTLELGLPMQWTIAEESEELGLRDEALRGILEAKDRKVLMQLLSWLSKGETNRGVFQLLHDSVTTMYDVFLDSSAEAWHRLKRRRGLSEAELDQLMVTLQEWQPSPDCDRRLATAVEKLYLQVLQSQWDEVLAHSLCRKIASDDTAYYGKPIPPDLCELVERIAAQGHVELHNRIQMQTEASYEVLHRFHQAFETLKFDRRVLTFADLARFLSRLEHRQRETRLEFRLDSAIDGLLLDEFQDTSLDQWLVIRPFADRASRHPGGRSFLCVGDEKQAIYGWRGGNSELLGSIATEIEGMDDEHLDHSYRSSPVVIDLVNQVNTQMSDHPNLSRAQQAIEQWTRGFPKHSTARTDLPGHVTLETSDVSASIEEGRLRAIECAAQRVAAIRGEAGLSRQLSIAVLVRTNQLVGTAINALRVHGIPASEEGGNVVTDSAAVQLIVSLLTLADYPQDSTSCFHLAHSPWAAQLNLELCRFSNIDSEVNRSLSQQLSSRVLRELADEGYGRTVARWIDELQPHCNGRERRRLSQLNEVAFRYQRWIEGPRSFGFQRQYRAPMRTAGFLRMIEKFRASDPTDDAVRVMNVHQSKGLQFDVVVLPDLDRRLIGQPPRCVSRRERPTERLETVVRYVKEDAMDAFPPGIREIHRGDERRRVREELCVLYVALTRAKHSVHMIVDPTVKSAEELSEREDGRGAKVKPTFAGVVRHALVEDQQLPPNKVVYEDGDSNWLKKTGPAESRREPSRLTSTATLRMKPRSMTGDKRRVGATIRPSDLEGGGQLRLGDRLKRSQATALQRGTLVHRFLESVEWLDDGLPDRAMLVSLGLSQGAGLDEINVAIERFYCYVRQPQVSHLLSRKYYQNWPASSHGGVLEVRSEQPVSVLCDGGWMSGSIDRMVLRRSASGIEAVDIVDFKTDRVAPGEHQRLVEFYRPQVAGYCTGISRMIRISPPCISASLLFLETDSIVEIAPGVGL